MVESFDTESVIIPKVEKKLFKAIGVGKYTVSCTFTILVGKAISESIIASFSNDFETDILYALFALVSKNTSEDIVLRV